MEKPRKGRPREAFRTIGHPDTSTVTMYARRKADRAYGNTDVWFLESRAEVNLIIRELEKARDRAFPKGKPDD